MAQKKTARHSKNARKTKPKARSSSILEQANESGWNAVQSRDLAAVIHMTLDRLDAQARDKVSDYLGKDGQENLQEIILTRFEIANEHRHAYSTLPDYLLRHPKVAAKLLNYAIHSVDQLIDDASIKVSKMLRPVLIAGLGAVYLSLIDTWRKDTSKDLSKTMATTASRIKLFFDAFSAIQGVASGRANHLRRFRQE